VIYTHHRKPLTTTMLPNTSNATAALKATKSRLAHSRRLGSITTSLTQSKSTLRIVPSSAKSVLNPNPLLLRPAERQALSFPSAARLFSTSSRRANTSQNGIHQHPTCSLGDSGVLVHDATSGKPQESHLYYSIVYDPKADQNSCLCCSSIKVMAYGSATTAVAPSASIP
jgi:hypothetical protein